MFQAPLVVGYKGEIGRFILAGLLEHLPKANDIQCVDVNNSAADVRDRLDKADYVFLCVPLHETEGWISSHQGELEGKTVVEQGSVKGFLYENPAFHSLRLLSMHLLFRPSATPPSERRGLVFSDRMPEAEVRAFSQEIEAVLQTPMALLEGGEEPKYILHDRLMARQQALVHRVLLVLSEFLMDEKAMTYVGHRVVELADRIRAGDPALYRMIQANPLISNELSEFEAALRRFEA